MTVPQRECNTVEEAKVEMDCDVLEETSTTPVSILMRSMVTELIFGATSATGGHVKFLSVV